MVEIEISTNLIPEFNYVVEVLFDRILGIPYSIINSKGLKHILIKVNSAEIIIPGDFWKLNEYFKKDNIPEKIFFSENQFISEKNIPVIFGNDLIHQVDGTIYCGIDIFASAFFMLTRWEEAFSDLKDEHGRFPASECLAYKNNFLKRPVVNEYAELLWTLLTHLGYRGNRISREFRIIPTHDIDQFRYWDQKKIKHLIKNLLGDIFIRQNPSLSGRRLWSFVSTLLGGKDPYNKFEYLMTKAESVGSKARFYFIAGGITAYENNYSVLDRKVRREIKSINKRGHITGVHPSYNAYNNQELLTEEVSQLKEVSGDEITESRNHYLRFEIKTTWHILQQAGLKTDSSMYFTDIPGFRCGVCDEFPVFDILQRKRLNLIERPLIVMDTSFKNKEPDVIYSEILQLKDTVKKYNGDFVFLWHNSNIDTPEWESYKRIFEEAFYGK